VLPKANRLARSADIRAVIKRGFVVRTPTVTAHVLPSFGTGIRFGFITSKRLGTAVVRNYTKRRFRELCRSLITDGACGADGVWLSVAIMWRLQPAATDADRSVLERDIAKVWRRASGGSGMAGMPGMQGQARGSTS